MIWYIVLFSLFFAVIGLLLNAGNAKYLLAGYNTMSESDRKSFDIDRYLIFFRNFHLVLSAICLFGGLLLYFFYDPDAAMMFVSLAPVVAYIWFIWKGKQYQSSAASPNSSKITYAAIIALSFCAGIMTLLFWYGNRENKMLLEHDAIEITGAYGEVVAYNSIQRIDLVTMPDISMRLNGYALSDTYKGYFRTRDGEKVKLLLNGVEEPLLMIEKNNGEKIYFSAKHVENTVLYERLQAQVRH